jgi:hypothetical protein
MPTPMPWACGDSGRTGCRHPAHPAGHPTTCQGGLTSDGHLPLNQVQQRFSDGSRQRLAAAAWSASSRPRCLRRGAAIHSIKAVPREDAALIAVQVVGEQPLHVYVSEQHAENLACQMYYGRTPTELLAEIGALGTELTAVHAAHLSENDISPPRRHRVPGRRLPDVRAATWPSRLAPSASCSTPGCRWASAPTVTPASTRSSSCASWSMHERLDSPASVADLDQHRAGQLRHGRTAIRAWGGTTAA